MLVKHALLASSLLVFLCFILPRIDADGAVVVNSDGIHFDSNDDGVVDADELRISAASDGSGLDLKVGCHASTGPTYTRQ